MAYVVRRASSGDVDGIIHVARETWEATYEHILPKAVRERVLSEWYAPQALLTSVENPGAAFYVAAADDGRVVGFANAGHRRLEDGTPSEDAELWRIYVLPHHQRSGLGRRLIHASVEALKNAAPVRRLYVQVETENDIGRRAYDALGFVPVREYEEGIFGYQTRLTEMCLEL